MPIHEKIWLSSPHMSGHEQEFVAEAFKTNWIAPLGPNVIGFENDISSYLGKDSHVAALSSGTAAIHLALIILGVTHGDEVICQSNTFSASANPIVYQGAHPVFVDSEAQSWNMCPELLEEAITDRIKLGKKPKAIIAVHLYGMPYNVIAINAIARKYEIPVIEDSAEALGSKYHDQKCGTFGDLSILSFNGNKIITSSGGGALVSKSEKVRKKAVFLATQARDKSPAYLHSQIGYNYRMSNVVAGIGRGQMKALDDYVVKRRANFQYYREALKELPLEFLNEPEDSYANRWLTCILTEGFEIREKIRLALEKVNIESRPLWKPMHQQPVFEACPRYVNGISDGLFENGLCLPSGSNLSEMQLKRVTTVIKEVV